VGLNLYSGSGGFLTKQIFDKPKVQGDIESWPSGTVDKLNRIRSHKLSSKRQMKRIAPPEKVIFATTLCEYLNELNYF
jgi:hypothetical protein